MNALLDELTQFSRAVRGETLLPHGVAACPHYPVSSALDIYRNNYRGNLHDALVSIFPVVVQIVGADFFRHLAYQFIEQYPSRSGNLHDYGAEMASFLTTFAPAHSLPYLSDVAALEWAYHLAYYAPDMPLFEMARLQQILAEQYADLLWLCHPACWLGHSLYPVADMWHAHQPGAAPDFHIDLGSGGGNVLVSRSQNTVKVHVLSAAMADWLQRIQAGTTMGRATDATLAAYPDFDLSATLSYLVTHEVLINFNLGEF